MYPPDLESVSTLSQRSEDKILLVVIDGLGGLEHPKFGNMSELEYASKEGLLKNLTKFVRERKTVTGRIDPVAPGYIPGSGAGHLGLFGYDPFVYSLPSERHRRVLVKRGAIEAAGVETHPGYDIVARVNFCKVDEDGIVRDRRADRLKSSPTRGKELAAKLNSQLNLPGVIATIVPTTAHRALLTLKVHMSSRIALSDDITNTDPGHNGKPMATCEPLPSKPWLTASTEEAAATTAEIVRELLKQTGEILKGEPDANMILLRAFARRPEGLPRFETIFSVRPAGIALYPLYRGVARLLGMAVLGGAKNFEDEVGLLKKHKDEYDFFFLHYKKPDLEGEDGDFLGKVQALGEFDKLLPRITKLEFSVTAITGDHSTPAVLGRHSDHPVPIAINARTVQGYDNTRFFTEAECARGALGRLRGVELMPTLLARANKFRKLGD